MGVSEVEGYGELIGGLRAQLAREVEASDEAPIVVDGQYVDYLAYSHDREDRQRGYVALVGALGGESPNRARLGLLAYVTSEDYGAAALDALVSSYEPRPSTNQ